MSITTTINVAELQSALDAINPASLHYNDWCKVGMGIHADGLSMDIWERWSQRDSLRFNHSACVSKWDTFKNDSNGVTTKTIFKMARDCGWTSQPVLPPGHPMDFDCVLTIDEPNEIYTEPNHKTLKNTIVIAITCLMKISVLMSFLTYVFLS